jgi:cell division protein ZapA (FtsZ GTPase activity inhibitor)
MKAYYLPRHDTKKTPVRSRLYTHLGPAATEALRQLEALLDKKYSAIGKPSRSLLLQVALLRFSANVQHNPAELKATVAELRAHAAPSSKTMEQA